MFNIIKKNNINSELSKYIKKQNNKFIKRYSSNYIFRNDIGQSVNNLVKQKTKKLNNPSFFIIILTSFITFFLAGYNCRLMK
jgi:hypothetical protein